MNTFREMLSEEETCLKKQILFLQGRLKDCSADALEVVLNHGHFQYYFREDDKGGNCKRNRKYIKRNNRAFAASLAQRDCDQKLLSDLEERLKAIENVCRTYDRTAPEEIINRFCSGRRALIQPLILTPEEYAEKWQTQNYKRKGFAENAPELYTVKGERVRSKSEKIIADTLERCGIPYHYEFPLELDGCGVIHPDFTVLNVRTGKSFFWEHLGKMDEEKYVKDAMIRIQQYQRNNILPGLDIIFTSETKTVPLDIKVLDNVIQRFLL